MSEKPGVKSRGKKKPFQIHWDEELKANFGRLLRLYDVDLDVAPAVIKLIRWAIAENWIPGYIRKERVVNNALTKSLDHIEKNS